MPVYIGGLNVCQVLGAVPSDSKGRRNHGGYAVSHNLVARSLHWKFDRASPSPSGILGSLCTLASSWLLVRAGDDSQWPPGLWLHPSLSHLHPHMTYPFLSLCI